MMPRTKGNHGVFQVVSSLQKYIRRGEELQAMKAALELADTSKAYCTMCLNRLQIISHEDIGLANPMAIVLVKTICEQITDRYDPVKSTGWRVMLANVVLFLCRSKKSREADHFNAVARFGDEKFAIPDYALDKHTTEGKKMGRGLKHFREVGAVLIPKPDKKDKYEDEAYRLWARLEKSEKGLFQNENEE